MHDHTAASPPNLQLLDPGAIRDCARAYRLIYSAGYLPELLDHLAIIRREHREAATDARWRNRLEVDRLAGELSRILSQPLATCRSAVAGLLIEEWPQAAQREIIAFAGRLRQQRGVWRLAPERGDV